MEETKEEPLTSRTKRSMKRRRSSLSTLVPMPTLQNLGIVDNKKNTGREEESIFDLEELAELVREDANCTTEPSSIGPQQYFPELHRFTLSFKNTELEEAFRLHTSGLTRSKVRRAFLVTLLLHLLLGAMEPFLGYSDGVKMKVAICRGAATAMSLVLWSCCYRFSDATFYNLIMKKLPVIYSLYSIILLVMFYLGTIGGPVHDVNYCPKYGYLSGVWSMPTELLFTLICFSSGMRLAWAATIFLGHFALSVGIPLVLMLFYSLNFTSCLYSRLEIIFVPLLAILCAVHGYDIEMHQREDFFTRCNIFRDRKRRNDIIESMLPADIAVKLKEGTRPNKLTKKYDQVTVLFCYICDFKDLSVGCSAAETVGFLHRLYSEFDYATDNQQVYKVEAIAESYICVSGLRSRAKTWNDPTETPEPNKACHMAALMMAIARRLLSRPDGKPIELKIGIHTGQVVAGVTGSKTYSYHLFGDTVNTASRMASTAQKGKVQLSKDTHRVLSGDLQLRCRQNPPVMVKGKGEMETYDLDMDKFDDNQLLKNYHHFRKMRSAFNPQFAEMLGRIGKTPQPSEGRESYVMEKIRVKGLKFCYKNSDGRYIQIGRRSSLSSSRQVSRSGGMSVPESLLRHYPGGPMQRSTSKSMRSSRGEKDDEETSAFLRQKQMADQGGAMQITPPRHRLSLSLITAENQRHSQGRMGSYDTARVMSFRRQVSSRQGSVQAGGIDESVGEGEVQVHPLGSQQRARSSLKSFATLAGSLAHMNTLAQLNSSGPRNYRRQDSVYDNGILDSFKDLEHNYQLDHNEMSLPNLRRFLYLVAAIMLVVLYIMDIMLQTTMTFNVKMKITLRMAFLGVTLFSIYASNKWHDFFIRNMQVIVSVIAVLFCLQVNAELLWNSDVTFLPVNIMLVIVASTLVDLRYTYVIATNLCCVVIYGVFIFMATENITEKKEATGFVMYLFFSCYVGSYGCWKLEKERRYNFLHKAILEHDRDLSEKLLKNMLPGAHHVHALIQDVHVADELDRVTILYSDFKGYTAWCNKQQPSTVYEILNLIYNAFDKHLDEQGVYKLETIGDAFVVVGGLKGFTSREHHALSVIKFAFCMLYELDMITKYYKLDFTMRIGIHTGPAVGGVVGIKKPRYLCWGKSTLIANELEAQGTPGRILVSKDTLMELTSQQRHANQLVPVANEKEVKIRDEVVPTYYIDGDVRPFLKINLKAQNSLLDKRSSGSSGEHNKSFINLLGLASTPERGKKLMSQLSRAASSGRRGSVFGSIRRRGSVSLRAGSVRMRRGSVGSQGSRNGNSFFGSSRRSSISNFGGSSKRFSFFRNSSIENTSSRGSIDSARLDGFQKAIQAAEMSTKSGAATGRSRQASSCSPAAVVPSCEVTPINTGRGSVDSLKNSEGGGRVTYSEVASAAKYVHSNSNASSFLSNSSSFQSFDEKDEEEAMSSWHTGVLPSHEEVDEEEADCSLTSEKKVSEMLGRSFPIDVSTVKSPKVLLPHLTGTLKLVPVENIEFKESGSKVINLSYQETGNSCSLDSILKTNNKKPNQSVETVQIPPDDQDNGLQTFDGQNKSSSSLDAILKKKENKPNQSFLTVKVPLEDEDDNGVMIFKSQSNPGSGTTEKKENPNIMNLLNIPKLDKTC